MVTKRLFFGSLITALTFHKDLDWRPADLTAPGRRSEEAEEMEWLGFDHHLDAVVAGHCRNQWGDFMFAHVRPPPNFLIPGKL